MRQDGKSEIYANLRTPEQSKNEFPNMDRAKPVEAILEEGDIVYIPRYAHARVQIVLSRFNRRDI